MRRWIVLGWSGEILDEIERVIRLVTTNPFAGTVSAAVEGSSIREWRLRKFPYSIIYRIREHDIRILAIAGHKRHPRYWHERR